MRFESNVDELAAETRPGIVRLDGPAAGGAGTVGGKLAAELAGRIHDRGMRGEGTDGRWDDNAPSVVERKGRNSPNVDTGEMLAADHIAGDVASTAGETTILYGKGTPGRGGKTDRDRAWYANEEGQSARRIKRPFFGVTDDDADALTEMAADEWDRKAGGG